MPDSWRCECGYTNLGSKTCLVCRRPRQAVPPPLPEARIDEPPPPHEQERPAKRPVKARAAKKAAPRKRSK
jgi:hypothetical protein